MNADKRRFFIRFLKTIRFWWGNIRLHPRSSAVDLTSWRLRAISICAAALLVFQPFKQQPATFQPSSHFYPITTGNAWSSQPSISADGRFIAFTSNADNLVPGDTNQAADIFVYDRQRTAMTRVSVAANGVQANALSARPAISADGRVVAFESLASNLVISDTNGMSDIFVHDRLTGETSRVSIGLHGEQGNGWSEAAAISGDGRWVAFLSAASNLFPGDANAVRDAFLYDRLTGLQQRVSIGPKGEDANNETSSVSINRLGTMLAFTSKASNLTAEDKNNASDIFSYSLGDFRTRRLANALAGDLPGLSGLGLLVSFLSPDVLTDQTVYLLDQWNEKTTAVHFAVPITLQALSADGQHLYAIGTADGTTFDLYHHKVAAGETALLAAGVANVRPAVSQDGQVIAFVQAADGVPQIQVADLRTTPSFVYTLQGQIVGPLGDPLAQVKISDNHGNWTETDRAGRFFLGGLPQGKLTLTPSKKGFAFEPANTALILNGDTTDIRFTYVYSDVLQEARLDIGMLYNHRCESGPACEGDFHGYAAGQCTDLVLDAFTWGAEYNLQLALWRDAQAHPEHFYQTGNAQDSFDMWRYFSYTNQMLPHEQPYQVGDLAFFDWNGDGEINHVSIISKVDKNNRPVSSIEATGVIDSNPKGLAAELPWEAFHENSVRGHARWNGVRQAPLVGVQPVMTLQIGVGSSGIQLQLEDLRSRELSATSHSIPGGTFFDLTWEQNLSVLQPLKNGGYYLARLNNPTTQELPYYFVAQVREDWEFGGVMLFTGTLSPGEERMIPLHLTDAGGLETYTWKPQRIVRQRR